MTVAAVAAARVTVVAAVLTVAAAWDLAWVVVVAMAAVAVAEPVPG